MAEYNDAREVERWGNIAQSLVDNEPGRKAYYDATVKEALAEMRLKMPNADNETLVVFAQSIAVLMLSVMNTTVDQLGAVLDSAFDVYAITTATLLGAYEPGNEPVPDGATGAPHEGLNVVEREAEPQHDEPSVSYGLYL